MPPETLFPQRPAPAPLPPELADFHSPSYQHALTAYNLAHEIHGDAILFDHAQAARSNRQLWRDYPELRGQYWQIGSSGQGDFWLLRRDGNICWYDHDLGEITPAAIVDFDITFDQFLALSAYLAQIERTLDTNEHYFAAPAHRQAFAHALNHIAQGLFARYPYRYFD